MAPIFLAKIATSFMREYRNGAFFIFFLFLKGENHEY